MKANAQEKLLIEFFFSFFFVISVPFKEECLTIWLKKKKKRNVFIVDPSRNS